MAISSNQPRIASGRGQVRFSPIENVLRLRLLPFKQGRGLFALGLWARRLRSICSHRFELGDDHYAWDGLLNYIDDYGFFGGFVRRFRRLGRLWTNFLEGRLPCTWFDSRLLGLCVFAAMRCAVFLALTLVPVRLADFLGVDLTFLPAFPRFEAVPLRANVRSFRLALTVSS